MHIFFVEDQSSLAQGILQYAKEIRGIQCSVYQGDLEDVAEFQRQLAELSVDFVLNTYEFADSKKVEQQPDKAWQINAIFPDHLAHICLEAGCALLHISTDDVVGETRGIPFHEKDTVHPLNAYGESKWQGEEAIRQLLKRRLILRLGTLFDTDEKGWLSQLVNQAESNKGVQDASDIMFSPTPVSDAARVIIAMLQQMDCGADCWGTYQYAGVEPISRFEFAELLVELGQDQGMLDMMAEARSVSAAALGLTGKQALHKEMNCQKIMDHFGIKQRSWRPALVEYLEHIADSRKAAQAEQAEEVVRSEESK